MSNYRWRTRPDVLATLTDTGSIKSWSSKNVVLKPNEAVTIISNGKIQDTLSETVLKNYTGGWTRWVGAKLGMGNADHKLLFTMTGPFDLMFVVDGQLSDGSKVKGIANLRLQFSREDTAKLLNVFANGPRTIDRAYVIGMYQNELNERVLRPLMSKFSDGISIRSGDFQQAFESACRTELRASLGLAGITMLKAFITVNETDVERLAFYRNQIDTAQTGKQIDADAELAEIERAREITLSRIGLEADVARAKARGEVEAQLEHELKDLRKQEAEMAVHREHEQGMADIRVGEEGQRMEIAMTAFEQVQENKRKRMQLESDLNQERQSQTDDVQKEMMAMAADHGAMSPEVLMEFLRQQTEQKKADK
jgi:hypothetical protein